MAVQKNGPMGILLGMFNPPTRQGYAIEGREGHILKSQFVVFGGCAVHGHGMEDQLSLKKIVARHNGEISQDKGN
jgi:hypothetical protein